MCTLLLWMLYNIMYCVTVMVYQSTIVYTVHHTGEIHNTFGCVHDTFTEYSQVGNQMQLLITAYIY